MGWGPHSWRVFSLGAGSSWNILEENEAWDGRGLLADCPASLGFSVVSAALLRGEAEGLRPLTGELRQKGCLRVPRCHKAAPPVPPWGYLCERLWRGRPVWAVTAAVLVALPERLPCAGAAAPAFPGPGSVPRVYTSVVSSSKCPRELQEVL